MLSSPLRNFPIVASDNPVDLINSAKRLYQDSISPVGPLPRGRHVLRGLTGPGFSLGFIASDLQVRILGGPVVNSYFVNFGVVGHLRATRNDQYANLNAAEATVFNPGDEQELRPTVSGSELLGLRIDADLVQDELGALLGHPVEAPPRFDLRLDLAQPNTRAVGMLVASLVEQLDSGDPLFCRPTIQHALIRSIVTSLLLAQRHNLTELLGEDEPRPSPPRAMRAALEFIDANLSERITLGDLAIASGCSARTIGALFVRELGVPPMTYLRDARLDRIRKEIRTGSDPVGTIAYRWGITHLGRFAADYRARFHEKPSETAARR